MALDYTKVAAQLTSQAKIPDYYPGLDGASPKIAYYNVISPAVELAKGDAKKAMALCQEVVDGNYCRTGNPDSFKLKATVTSPMGRDLQALIIQTFPSQAPKAPIRPQDVADQIIDSLTSFKSREFWENEASKKILRQSLTLIAQHFIKEHPQDSLEGIVEQTLAYYQEKFMDLLGLIPSLATLGQTPIGNDPLAKEVYESEAALLRERESQVSAAHLIDPYSDDSKVASN